MALSYPVDYSGIASTNKIEDEHHVVRPPALHAQSNYTVPRAAPFFYLDLEIWTGPKKTGRKLVKGADYYPSLKFEAGSLYLRKPLYGGIVYTDHSFSGDVYLHYQTLGGDFVLDAATIIENVTGILTRDIRFYSYDQLIEVPSAFPPDAHIHPVEDYRTWADVANGLHEIAVAILSAGADGSNPNYTALINLINSHINAQNNAHTPQAVGLGLVPNYPAATEKDVTANSNITLMTPALTNYQFAHLIKKENLDTIRDGIKSIIQSINSINDQIQSINVGLSGIHRELMQQNLLITALERNLAQMSNRMDGLADEIRTTSNKADEALTASNFAAGQVDNLAKQINNLLYVRNAIYSEGSNEFSIPAGSSVQVTLIGAGGGSGDYYQTNLDLLMARGQATDGLDSVLYYLGTRSVPVEPVPILVAEGGKAGYSSYSNLGASKGGSGGKTYKWETASNQPLKLSSLKTVDLAKLLLGNASSFGLTGRTGDTANDPLDMPGTGGYYLNSSADKYRRRYGRGGKGISRAGLGGSGGYTSIIIQNDTDDAVYFSAVVGLAGDRDWGMVEADKRGYNENFESHGVAVVVLVA